MRIPVRKIASGAAVLPWLPARMLWMRAMRAVERASREGVDNAASAVAEREWIDLELEDLLRGIGEPVGANR